MTAIIVTVPGQSIDESPMQMTGRVDGNPPPPFVYRGPGCRNGWNVTDKK